MKFMEYNDYLDHYVGDFKFLDECGDHAYYYDEENEHVIKIPTETTWRGGIEPETFYSPKSVRALLEVLDNRFDYDNTDELFDALEFAESLDTI